MTGYVRTDFKFEHEDEDGTKIVFSSIFDIEVLHEMINVPQYLGAYFKSQMEPGYYSGDDGKITLRGIL